MNADYEAYMKSEEWKSLKARLGYRARNEGCIACRRKDHLELHHMYYPKNIWDTHPDDVCWLCLGCHEAFHRACTGEREKYKAWAINPSRTIMLIRAQRQEEEYQPIGMFLAAATRTWRR